MCIKRGCCKHGRVRGTFPSPPALAASGGGSDGLGPRRDNGRFQGDESTPCDSLRRTTTKTSLAPIFQSLANSSCALHQPLFSLSLSPFPCSPLFLSPILLSFLLSLRVYRVQIVHSRCQSIDIGPSCKHSMSPRSITTWGVWLRYRFRLVLARLYMVKVTH